MLTAVIIVLVLACSTAASILMGRIIDAGGSWEEEADVTESKEGA